MPLDPFIIYALPRSRTAWLSQYLSYGGWSIGHDEARHVRSLEDVRSWFAMPMSGTVETAAAPFWRLVREIAPRARIVTIRRDPREVIGSLLNTGAPFDIPSLERLMHRLDAKLDQIERRTGAWSIPFADLDREDVCASLTETLLGQPHDPFRWGLLRGLNVQINFAALIRYAGVYMPQMERAARMAGQHMRAKIMGRPLVSAEFTFQQEPLSALLRDGQDLISEHLVTVGEAPDSCPTKNLPLLQKLEDIGALHITTARQNGRMFGYLLALTAPSLESDSKSEGMHTSFYTSPLAPGLGLKLQRASVAFLRDQGVDQVLFRAGVRGSGPRMGALYRRLGAEPFGEMFSLPLKETA
jgi:hypothetical protein